MADHEPTRSEGARRPHPTHHSQLASQTSPKNPSPGARLRSRSPRRDDPRAHRTRSPHGQKRRHDQQHHSHRHKHTSNTVVALPHNSRQITKGDYEIFRPMFALYLDVQKGKVMDDMDETEVKGRWKSFIGKWNRGELAEGWYDPTTLQKAISSAAENTGGFKLDEQWQGRDLPIDAPTAQKPVVGEESDSDDSVGPTLPGQEGRSRRSRVGPSIPNLQDLELKREMKTEDGLAYRDDIRHERKLDKRAQKEALNELVPQAEPGTRERQLEKKKELNEKLKSFRERSPGAAEVPDTELMGGGDGLESYKKEKQDFERKKNERELRKEEILRARMAEREERLQEYRTKEEGTMKMLKELAKQRFG